MITLTDELKTKLLAAQDVNEVTALLKAEGQGISPEDAERLWEEIFRKREKDGKELSLDELEAVSGGRDYEKEGCAATVEPDSWCWSDDECFLDEVFSQHPPRKKLCPPLRPRYCHVPVHASFRSPLLVPGLPLSL